MMFKSFLKSTPSISIFHNAASPQSQRALKLLRNALTNVPKFTSNNNATIGNSGRSASEKMNTQKSKNENSCSLAEVLQDRPLEFDLEVVEGPPTSDQMRTILGYLKSEPSSVSSTASSTAPNVFLSAHPSSTSTSPGASLTRVAELARTSPSAFRWPVVVDWDGGRAAIGNLDDVERILDAIKKEQQAGGSTR